jgi:hypothetical protein
MRPNAEFIAQTAIQGPNGVRAYNVGDDVPASAVENLGLTVGLEVLPANANIIPRPAKNAKRADWEAYWLGQNVGQDEIDGMTRDEMAAREPVFEVVDPAATVNGGQEVAHPAPDHVAVQSTEQASIQEPPGPNALKADWVAYAVARRMDEKTAQESTVAQLQAFDYDHLP